MSLMLLSPAAGEPLALDDAKAHLRLTGGEEDAEVARLLAAATRAVEARGGFALMESRWRLILDQPPEETLLFPVQPVTAIDAVTVSGEAVPASAWEFAPGLEARLRAAAPWPSPVAAIGDVAIDFTAGHAQAEDIPASLAQAVRLALGSFYENREEAGAARTFALPKGLDPLIAPYRSFRL